MYRWLIQSFSKLLESNTKIVEKRITSHSHSWNERVVPWFGIDAAGRSGDGMEPALHTGTGRKLSGPCPTRTGGDVQPTPATRGGATWQWSLLWKGLNHDRATWTSCSSHIPVISFSFLLPILISRSFCSMGGVEGWCPYTYRENNNN
jgi:hypothetical protein